VTATFSLGRFDRIVLSGAATSGAVAIVCYFNPREIVDFTQQFVGVLVGSCLFLGLCSFLCFRKRWWLLGMAFLLIVVGAIWLAWVYAGNLVRP
jgi:hypothetical protein